MHINIKNHEAHNMAVELSQLTGETISKAVTKSIALRLKAEKENKNNERKGIADQLLNISKEYNKLSTLDERSPDEVLYDANGLIKERE